MVEFVLLIASSLLIAGLTYALVRQPGRLRQGIARTARLQRLTHLNQLVSASLDLEHVLREITQAAAMLTDTAFVHIWIADDANQTLELQATSDDRMAADYPVTKLSYGEGGAGWVARHRQRLLLPNIFADERVQVHSVEWWRTHGLSSLLAVPVIDQGSLLGGFVFTWSSAVQRRTRRSSAPGQLSGSGCRGHPRCAPFRRE